MKPTITALAMEARRDAAEVTARHKKHASFRLYSVLAPCLEICERCIASPADRAEIDALFRQQPHDGNRRYVERGSDIYVLVCRFVFSGTNRTNAMRYACALREAVKLGIDSQALAGWMKKNGGVNALYFRRPLEQRVCSVKALRLDRPITFSRDEPFSLTLQWQPDNSFAVVQLECST